MWSMQELLCALTLTALFLPTNKGMWIAVLDLIAVGPSAPAVALFPSFGLAQATPRRIPTGMLVQSMALAEVLDIMLITTFLSKKLILPTRLRVTGTRLKALRPTNRQPLLLRQRHRRG